MSHIILPPKKRDWKPGTSQVGIFLRTPKGSKIEMVANTATPEICACVSLALEHSSLKTGAKSEHTFDEWVTIWKDRLEAGDELTPGAAETADPA